ncbi:hypothetical protein I2W78_14840 [Streptomyces spinoverrucosus]|nr:hypothetical protein [Streptomyces spinoverrucosus]
MTMRTKVKTAVLGAALAGSLALVSCGNGSQERAGGQDVIATDSKEALPSSTATDWVSYGDQVAVVRVTAEQERRDTGGAAEGGEEYLPRTVDLRVDERVWSRSGAPALPDSLSVTVDGWQVKGDSRVRVGTPDASRLEIGHDYVISFARFTDGAWAPLGSGGVLPYDDGRVGEGEFEGDSVTVDAYRSALRRQLVPGSEEPLAYRAAGKPASAVRGILRKATPDPTAAQHFDLDPIARYQKVAGVAEPADTFCSVASPLAVSEGSRHTPDELAPILTDLADMASDDGAPLRTYATSLRSGGSAPVDDTARKSSIDVIEKECGIEVGDLLPSDTDAAE